MAVSMFHGFEIHGDVSADRLNDSDSELLPRSTTPSDARSRLIVGEEVSIVLDRAPASYYRHGWQSWSLACWHDVAARVPVQKPAILHPMQTDPLHAHETGPAGSWLGAVRFDDGAVLLLGSLGTDARVEFVGNVLSGRSELASLNAIWLVAIGTEDSVFGAYAKAVGEHLGVAPGKPAPRVWCSWYSLYTGITEDTIATVVDGLRAFPVDTIQIDDGWQLAVGDWEPNAKFPSGMPGLAAGIRDTGKSAGLWLAPLIAVESSRLVREHPDWVLRDERDRPVSAGFNWGEQLYAVDTTNPAAVEWLVALMETVRRWGFDYLKLDFLYGGALPGRRHRDMPREAAYREALRVMRTAMGDAYFVTCGAPILPSLGLCDALRIGPDVAGFWESHRDECLLHNPAIPGTRNAVRTTLHRLWLAPIVAMDPDVVYLAEQGNGLTADQLKMNQALARICSFTATSDLPSWLSRSQTEPGAPAGPVEAAFSPSSTIARTGPYSWTIDGEHVRFDSALGLPGPRTLLDRIIGPLVSWLGSRRFVLRIMDSLGVRSAAKKARAVR